MDSSKKYLLISKLNSLIKIASETLAASGFEPLPPRFKLSINTLLNSASACMAANAEPCLEWLCLYAELAFLCDCGSFIQKKIKSFDLQDLCFIRDYLANNHRSLFDSVFVNSFVFKLRDFPASTFAAAVPAPVPNVVCEHPPAVSKIPAETMKFALELLEAAKSDEEPGVSKCVGVQKPDEAEEFEPNPFGGKDDEKEEAAACVPAKKQASEGEFSLSKFKPGEIVLFTRNPMGKYVYSYNGPDDDDNPMNEHFVFEAEEKEEDPADDEPADSDDEIPAKEEPEDEIEECDDDIPAKKEPEDDIEDCDEDIPVKKESEILVEDSQAH